MTWKTRPYTLPLSTPYRWAGGVQTERQGVLVTDGLGWGECALPPHESNAGFAQRVAETTDWQAAQSRIRCGFATAHWDSQARQQDITLAQALGDAYGLKPTPQVEVNALVTAPLDVLVDRVQSAVAAGFTTLKIKMGAADDLERLAVVRKNAPGCTLRLDPNGAWTNPQEMLDAVAGPDIEYVEDPAANAIALDGPIAADAWAVDMAAIEHIVANNLASHVVLKPQRLGGPDKLIEAYLFCRDAGISCTVTNSLESSVGLHAALHQSALVPGVHGLATARYFGQDVAPTPPIKAGFMAVVGPGSGVHID